MFFIWEESLINISRYALATEAHQAGQGHRSTQTQLGDRPVTRDWQSLYCLLNSLWPKVRQSKAIRTTTAPIDQSDTITPVHLAAFRAISYLWFDIMADHLKELTVDFNSATDGGEGKQVPSLDIEELMTDIACKLRIASSFCQHLHRINALKQKLQLQIFATGTLQ